VNLLPTPVVNDMGDGKTVDWWDNWIADAKAKHGNGNGHGNSLAIEVQRDLLPTPRTSDTNGAGQHGTGGPDLRTAITLLPTPRVRHGDDNESGHRRKSPGIEAATYHFPQGQWGKYGPAIARWENATRPAPAPTEPNSKGNPRLSAAFSEWMMGWPEGWVTDVPGIKRSDALRIVGNGVCPQQATAALAYLLTVAAL